MSLLMPTFADRSLALFRRMKWSSAQLDEVRRMCESVGTLFTGEAIEPPVLLF